MDHSPLVSVIIPSFNHDRYIFNTIQSVLDQTFSDFEIIITDDCSTDNTVEIIKQFDDSRIKLYRNKNNLGISGTLNHSITQSQGKYLSILGSDDMFEKAKLMKQVKYMEDNKETGAVFSWANIIDQDGKDINNKSEFFRHFQRYNKTREQWLNYFFYNDNCLCASSAMVRRKHHDEVGEYDQRYHQLQDYDFWIRLLLKNNIYIIPEVLIKYRVLNNKANVSAEKRETINRLPWEKLNILESYLDIKNIDELTNIFPKENIFITANKKNKNPVPEYAVAQLSLNKTTMHKIFAINTLYKLLRDKKIAKEILKNYNFSFKDLIKISGEYDLFNNQLNHDLRVKNELYIKHLPYLRLADKLKNISKIFKKNK